MQLRPEIQITAIVKAMKDVVIPAVDADNKLATEQAQLIVGLLTLMAHQLPRLFHFDCDELQRLIACASQLEAIPGGDPAIGAAQARLGADATRATALLERCSVNPAALTEAVREMRAALATLMSAAAPGQDPAALRVIEGAVLDLSRQQLLRDRALLLPQGWEPDPTAIPDIDTLLR